MHWKSQPIPLQDFASIDLTHLYQVGLQDLHLNRCHGILWILEWRLVKIFLRIWSWAVLVLRMLTFPPPDVETTHVFCLQDCFLSWLWLFFPVVCAFLDQMVFLPATSFPPFLFLVSLTWLLIVLLFGRFQQCCSTWKIKTKTLLGWYTIIGGQQVR